MLLYSERISDLLHDGDFLKGEERSYMLKPPIYRGNKLNEFHFTVDSQEKSDNGKSYNIVVLFEDIFTVAKDEGVGLDEAVHTAFKDGNVYVACTCPAWQYWGYKYMSTKLRYKWDGNNEDRYPKERNPNLRGNVCKHVRKVLNWVLNHEDEIEASLRDIYDSRREGEKVTVLNSDGEEYTVFIKGNDNDPFVSHKEEEDMNVLFETDEDAEPTQKEEKEEVIENELLKEEADEDIQEIAGWTIPDPTADGFEED